MLTWLLLGALALVLYKVSLWFLDPYLRYRNRKKVKEYVLFEKGEAVEPKGVKPYLLDNKKYDVDLSLIVPAYNEVNRLPKMLTEDTLPYLRAKLKEGKLFKKVEIIIVNDGSKDKTGEMIQKYTKDSTD